MSLSVSRKRSLSILGARRGRRDAVFFVGARFFAFFAIGPPHEAKREGKSFLKRQVLPQSSRDQEPGQANVPRAGLREPLWLAVHARLRRLTHARLRPVRL